LPIAQVQAQRFSPSPLQIRTTPVLCHHGREFKRFYTIDEATGAVTTAGLVSSTGADTIIVSVAEGAKGTNDIDETHTEFVTVTVNKTDSIGPVIGTPVTGSTTTFTVSDANSGVASVSVTKSSLAVSCSGSGGNIRLPV
jgi:hypothetical protein